MVPRPRFTRKPERAESRPHTTQSPNKENQPRSLVKRLLWLLMIFVAWPTPQAVSTPLGTGFTYQGQLILNGSPYNGTATLRFSLWDAAGSGSPPVGGAQIGSSQLLVNVPVTNGLFVVELNDAGTFGPNAFNGDARWLQVEVCTDVSCTSGTVLAPRQQIRATPYSRFSAAPWQLLGGNV